MTVIAAGIICFAVLAAPADAGASIDDPDIDTEADYRYTVDVDENVVQVRIDLTVIADKPDRTTAEGVYQYYFAGYSLPIPSEAENLRVEDRSGGELVFERQPLEDADQLDISFRRNLFHRQAAEIVISFTLAAGQAGSENIARINQAYASFVAWTSPVIEQASVTVVVPEGFVDLTRSPTPFAISDVGGEQHLVAENVDPENYFALVSVANDDALDVHVIDLDETFKGGVNSDLVDGSAIRVLSWPDDLGWRDHVIGGVEDGLPLLVDLVGRPWPIEGDLTIMESFSPILDGYAGWYDQSTGVIEVSDTQDDHTLFHELSHVWFHRQLFSNRWINEGLADFYAAETIAAMGDERPQPEPVSRADDDAIPLLDFDLEIPRENERWGYVAAWSVMESIVDEVGLAALTDVLTAVEEGHATYLGDDAQRTVNAPTDWRRFLDLVENDQGLDEGPIAAIFHEWVLRDPEFDEGGREALADRGPARSRYLRLIETADGWAAPVGIRDAMMFWRFEEAERLMADAEAALAQRDDLLDLIEPTGARLPSNIEEAYEATDTSYAELTAALDEAAAAGAEVREAHDSVTRSRSLLERIGLIGTDFGAASDGLATTFSEGRLTQAIERADDIDALIDGAQRAGLLRLGSAAGFVSAVTGGVWFMRSRRRHQHVTVK